MGSCLSVQPAPVAPRQSQQQQRQRKLTGLYIFFSFNISPSLNQTTDKGFWRYKVMGNKPSGQSQHQRQQQQLQRQQSMSMGANAYNLETFQSQQQQQAVPVATLPRTVVF